MKKWVSGTSGIGGFSICPLLGREGLSPKPGFDPKASAEPHVVSRDRPGRHLAGNAPTHSDQLSFVACWAQCPHIFVRKNSSRSP